MAALIARMFGAGPPRPPTKQEPETTSFEKIQHSRATLQRISDSYVKKIEEQEKIARLNMRAGQEKVAYQHLAFCNEISETYSKHTALLLSIERVAEHVRMGESLSLAVKGMSESLDLMKKMAKNVNYEDAARLRTELEKQQEELAETQKLLAKPMRGLMPRVFDEAALADQMDELLERPVYGNDETEEEGATAAPVVKPTAVQKKDKVTETRARVADSV
jgi:hypothetical protein